MALYHQRLTRTGSAGGRFHPGKHRVGIARRHQQLHLPRGRRRRQPNHTGDLTRLRAVSDGYVLPNPGIGASLDWQILVDFLEAPELDDPKFDNASARLENAEELGEILDQIFATKQKQDIFYAAHQKRFIYGVIDSPRKPWKTLRSRRATITSPWSTPIWAKSPFPGAPFLMSGSPWDVQSVAPTLGQHNATFLRALGYDAQQMAYLSASEVI